MIKWIVKLYHKTNCLIGVHETYTYADRGEYQFDDVDFKNMSPDELFLEFERQTTLRCRHCDWKYNGR